MEDRLHYNLVTLFNQFASFNNKPFRFLYKTTATKKEQQNGWVWHNLFDRKVFLKINRENRIKCIVCNWSIFLKAAYNLVIFFCICVLSSVFNLMHLWQSPYFLDKFFLYSSTYAWLIPYHIIEVKSSRENMKKKWNTEDASSDQLLPDTFHVYQFPFIIWIISICILWSK